MHKNARADAWEAWIPHARSRRAAQPGPLQARVERTRRALLDALLESILEGEWEGVRIETLCERARVRRTTFYNHFAGKEELLLSGFDDLPEKLRDVARREGEGRLAFLGPLVRYVHDRPWIGRVLGGKGSSQLVRLRIVDIIVEHILADEADATDRNLRRVAVARYAAGAVVESLQWWLATDVPVTVGEVVALLEQLTAAVLDVPA